MLLLSHLFFCCRSLASFLASFVPFQSIGIALGIPHRQYMAREIDNYDVILVHCLDEDEETAKDAFFYSLQYAHPDTIVALENETFTELWEMLRDGGVVSPLEAEQHNSCGIVSVHQLQRAQEYRKTKNLQVQRIE